MPVMTARIDRRPAAPTGHPTRPSYVGAVLLDAMAAIAGPPWQPDYERSWSTAFDIVARAAVSA